MIMMNNMYKKADEFKMPTTAGTGILSSLYVACRQPGLYLTAQPL